MYDQIPGMAAAQRAYDNATPFESDCDCPPLFMCETCDDITTEPGTCTHGEDAADYDGPTERKAIEREDSELFAEPGCSQHGSCGGCTSRWCEDCNG